MNHTFRPLTALTGVVLLSSSLLAPANAIEQTTSGGDSLAVYSSLKALIGDELQNIHNEIQNEALIRETTDNTISGELQTRVNQTTARIVALENRLPGLSTQIESLFTTVNPQLVILKAQVTALETDMRAAYELRLARINQINTEMGQHAVNLQNQLNSSQARINALYVQLANINTSINQLNAFLTDISNRLAAQRACVAAGTCVRQSAPTITLYNDIGHWAGWEFFGGGMYGNVVNTGYSTSYYQFCAVSGNTGMGGRDFYVYQSGGYWHIANERDNAMPGDESGMVYMNCMHIG